LSGTDLKRYIQVVEANNTVLTQHFLRLLCKLEERITVLEEKISELHSHLLWLEKELKEVE